MTKCKNVHNYLNEIFYIYMKRTKVKWIYISIDKLIICNSNMDEDQNINEVLYKKIKKMVKDIRIY